MLIVVRFCPHCFSIYTSQVDHCGIDGTKLTEESEDPLVGRVLDRYRVLERLGLGAMGCVYRVAHTFLEHEYAMKVLFGDLSANKRVVERFRREAQVVSKIRHPNVVAVTDFGTTPNGLTFLVMEYVGGRTLADIIATEAPFTPSRAANIARQIAAGLAEAHRQEFIHRDIKPSNVMVWSDGRHEYVKLLDFGIVGLVPGETSVRITGAGHFVGTPLYMAPEQSRDPQKITPAADLYGLGIILYEMLAAHPPFDAESVVDLFIKHSTAPVPALPPAQGLELLVNWLLEKRPDRRPSRAEAVIAELDRLASARTYSVQLRPSNPTFIPALDAATLDGTHDGPSELPAPGTGYPDPAPTPSVPLPAIFTEPTPTPLVPAAFAEPAPTPSLPVSAVATSLPINPDPGRPEPLDYDFLRGRMDYVAERLERADVRAEARVVLQTRLRRLQAALRSDADGHKIRDVARELSDLDRDLTAVIAEYARNPQM